MYYQIEQMDGYYRISSPEMAFCYLIVGSEKAMLIDTGYGYGDLNAAVRSVTEKPLIIVNTHGHCDHTGANAQFDVPCYIHKKDMEFCREHNRAEMRRSNAERARHSADYVTGEEFNALPDGFDLDVYSRMGCGNLAPVAEGDIFDLGGATMEIIETPGHTQGGISVLYREKNILFIGDAANRFVWMFAPEATDVATYIATVEKMYSLSADAYLGGHDPDPVHLDTLQLFIRTALEADYEKGEPFESFFAQECEPRVCTIDGKTIANIADPDFAAIVLGKNH